MGLDNLHIKYYGDNYVDKFYQEIEQNLRILHETTDKAFQEIGDNAHLHIDLGFIEILNQDIEDLKKMAESSEKKRNVHPLTLKLQMVSERMIDLADPIFDSQTQKRKLMSDKPSGEEIAKFYTSGSTSVGLSVINQKYNLHRIAGDGHCLFRAILGSLLLNLVNTNRFADYIQYLELNQKLSSSSLLVELKKLQDSSDSFQDVISLMQDEHRSNELVKFFRDLACSYNEVHQTDVLQSEISTSEVSTEEYFNNMRNMDKPHMGGHPELLALANMLGLTFHILHADEIGKAEDKEHGKGEEELKAAHHRIEGRIAEEDALVIPILFRSAHYDAATLKTH